MYNRFCLVGLVLFFLILILFFKNTNDSRYDRLIESTYVINLESNSDRMNILYSMAKRANINLERIDAIDTRNENYLLYRNHIDSSSYIELSDTVRTKFRKKDDGLTPGAIGCYLSHLKVYRTALQKGEKCIMIFEDDAIIPSDFKYNCMNYIESLPPDWDVCLFGWVPRSKKNKKINDKLYKIDRFILLHCYAITDIGMKKILHHGYPIIKKQIDHMISDHSSNIEIYGVHPRNFIKQGNLKNNSAYVTNIQIPLDKSF